MDENKTVNVLQFRSFVNVAFEANREQDVAELFNGICEKIEEIRNAVKHKVKDTITCCNNKCNYTVEREEHSLVFLVNIKEENNVSLQDLIDRNLVKKLYFKRKCEECGHEDSYHKQQIDSVGNIIVLQL